MLLWWIVEFRMDREGNEDNGESGEGREKVK